MCVCLMLGGVRSGQVRLVYVRLGSVMFGYVKLKRFLGVKKVPWSEKGSLE